MHALYLLKILTMNKIYQYKIETVYVLCKMHTPLYTYIFRYQYFSNKNEEKTRKCNLLCSFNIFNVNKNLKNVAKHYVHFYNEISPYDASGFSFYFGIKTPFWTLLPKYPNFEN